MLPDDFLLPAAVLLNLIGQDEAVHGQCGKDVTKVYEWEDIDEQLHGKRHRHRQYGDEESKKYFTGKPLPAFNNACEMKQQGCNDRYQRKRVQRTAEILVSRCDINETVDEQDAGKQDKANCPQAKHGVKEPAPVQIFITVMQHIYSLHKQRQ